MNLLIIMHVAISSIIEWVRAYTIGLWFCFRHPILFVAFVNEWMKFRHQIADVDEKADAGYYDLNRSQRRRVDRIADKVNA